MLVVVFERRVERRVERVGPVAWRRGRKRKKEEPELPGTEKEEKKEAGGGGESRYSDNMLIS